MVSTFTPNKSIEQPAHNDYVNTWDVPFNADWGQIDKAFGNSASKNSTGLSGNQTLAVADYVPLTLIITGLPTAAITYVVPSGVGGQWVFANATTGGFNVGIKSNAGGTTILCPAGQNTLVSCDGSASGMRLSVTTLPAAAGSNTQVQYNSGGITSASPNFTFDGTTVGMTGLNNTGSTVLGDASGDVLTINGTTVTIPNNLNFDANTLFIDATNNRVGIGTNTPANTLSVAGNIQSTSGGFIFPDATVQTTSAAVPTGFIQDYVGTTAPSGWVIANGQTIGNGSSGGTGRANADTAALFTLLWNSWANAQAAVSGGRGANAAADFAANKTIALPDLRGTVIAGLDNMGGTSSAGRLSSSMASTTIGAALSVGSVNSAAVSVSVSGGVSATAFTSGIVTTTVHTGGALATGGAGPNTVTFDHDHLIGADAGVSGTFSGGGSGSTAAFNIAQSTMVMTKLIKL